MLKWTEVEENKGPRTMGDGEVKARKGRDGECEERKVREESE